jgi:peroxiredoxin Q/BCP
MNRSRLFVMAAAAVAFLPAACLGQNAEPLKPGNQAPDFAIPGATRHGILRDPVRLSDYRGETVVLAFFYRARTPG